MIKFFAGVGLVLGDVIAARAGWLAWPHLAHGTAHQRNGALAAFGILLAVNVIILAVAVSRAKAKAAAAAATASRRPSYTYNSMGPR